MDEWFKVWSDSYDRPQTTSIQLQVSKVEAPVKNIASSIHLDADDDTILEIGNIALLSDDDDQDS